MALERVGSVVSAGATVLLALSVFYDFNYLWALGIRFSDVSTSLADHIRSAIIWLPLYLSCVLTAFVILVGYGIAKHAKSQNVRRTAHLGSAIFHAVGIGAMVALALMTPSYGSLYLFGAMAWMAVVSALERPSWNPWARTALRLGPMTVLMVGLGGYIEGERALRQTSPKWGVAIQNGNSVDVEVVLGLRRFGESAVVVGRDRHVRIVPSNAIVSARHTDALEPPKALTCEWFGWRCP